MSLYQNTVSIHLAAAVANGVCLSQKPLGAGNLTINGSLATGGVATFDVPRRVVITTDADDHTKTFTVTGTGFNGLPLSESILGGSSVAVYTVHDFATVTQVSVSAATTGNITVGTNAIASTIPIIMDTIVNPATYGAAVITSGTINYTVELSYDDYAPLWDLNANTPTWFSASTGFASQTGNVNGTIAGPCTMIRLTQNSGTGTATLKLIKPLIAGPF